MSGFSSSPRRPAGKLRRGGGADGRPARQGPSKGPVQPFAPNTPATPDWLRVLAKMTPGRLRAIARRLDDLCLYGGADEVEASEAALILHEAAAVCR